MTKNIYLETLKSVLGCSSLHYYNHIDSFETFQQSIFQHPILFVEESSFKVAVIE